ncbi:MAG: endolytic transglycosylase MltG, partial [Myxococcota bacterium]
EALAELEAPLEHESTAPEPATAEHPPPLPVEEPEADPIQSLLDPDEPLGEAWSLAYATAAALPEWSEDANATVLPPPRPVLVNSDGVSEAIPEGAEVRPARRWLLPVLSAALTLLIGLPSLALLSLAPPSDEATDAIVRIPEGESLGSIAARLHDAGTLRSPLAFKLVAIATGIDRTLKAGTYRLPQNVFGWEIASELSRGQINLRQLTIPEGLTLDEIASLIAEAGLASRSGFVEAARDRALLRELGIAGPSAEGYLYPETYRLAKGLSPHDIVRIMVEQFETVRRELGVEAHRLPLHDWVTLASIVEREVVAPKEMAKVAGVFRNRLQREMRLESCATVQYILGEPKAKLTLDDVRIPSPYNTYLHEGLPPGPIASPGIDALRAAAFPETHEYLFFVAREDGSGTHVFSKSYTEHRRAQTQIQK